MQTISQLEALNALAPGAELFAVGLPQALAGRGAELGTLSSLLFLSGPVSWPGAGPPLMEIPSAQSPDAKETDFSLRIPDAQHSAGSSSPTELDLATKGCRCAVCRREPPHKRSARVGHESTPFRVVRMPMKTHRGFHSTDKVSGTASPPPKALRRDPTESEERTGGTQSSSTVSSKRHRCSQCGKAFSQASNLRSHEANIAARHWRWQWQAEPVLAGYRRR
jgi:hypothetical protein